MRVLKNMWFTRFARRERISDAMLCEAVARADRGLIDADLGSGLIKQRFARPGSGRSGGYRTLFFFRRKERAVFAFGFAKSDLGNIGPEDEIRLKQAARITLGLTDSDLDTLVTAGTLIEVQCDGQHDDVEGP